MSRKTYRLPAAFWLLLIALCGLCWPAQTATIRVDELRPGMTGWGLSVFGPTGMTDTFHVELIDVMRNVTPSGDMLVVRCSGQGLEHTGIVAGMSGSPVYFDGRLAGALAYGWGFAKDPIGGVTPVGEMLELLSLPPAPSPNRKGSEGSGGRASRWMKQHRQPSPESSNRWYLDPLPSRPLPLGSPYSHPPSRLPLPLGITGSSPELLALAGFMLESTGLLPVAAGTAATGPIDPDSFRPGGAIGVLLADGDVRFSAIGTVTWVEGNRLLAFGHPMFQAGTVALPLSAAEVHAVVPSYASSFKLFSVGPAVGTFVQDRRPAVSGVIGPVPPMLPVRVSLQTPAARRDYRFRIAQFEPLIPALTALGIAEVVYATEGAWEETTLEARVSLKPAGLPAISFRHVYADRAPADLLARAVWDRLRVLTDNPFQPVRLESLDISLSLHPGRRRTTITGVQPARTTLAPGDTIALWLQMRDDTGRTWSQQVRLPVPMAAPAGRLTLSLSSSDTFLLRESYRAPGTVEPENLDELLQLLGRVGDEDVLVIAGHSGTPGISVGPQELPAIPPTLRRVLASGRRTGRVRPVGESRLFVKRLKLDGVVAGTYEIPLEVRR